jgi:hypothetical protein
MHLFRCGLAFLAHLVSFDLPNLIETMKSLLTSFAPGGFIFAIVDYLLRISESHHIYKYKQIRYSLISVCSVLQRCENI